ncbi:MAG: universal stress protein [Salinisphaera sp.]|jgi:nucleotide-binding universal stress UspA family protein|nr:universal stress protein [Salinisphaera sp.]
MDYKSLLVYANDPQHDARAMDTASSVAQRFDAYLTGLFVHDPIYYQYPLLYEGNKPGSPEEVPGKDKHTKATKAAFEQACNTYGLVKTDWEFVMGEPLQTLSMHARYADAVFMSQTNADFPPNSPTADPDLPAKIAMASARPVICVPFQGKPKTIGRRILIAWNDSREASQAVTAALPFLRTAECINILVVNTETDSKGNWTDPAAGIARYLSRHNVEIEAVHMESDADNVTRTLLWGAGKMDADLICMGAYGHSRLREFALGGVTRDMIRESPVPVLLAH